MLHCKEPIKTVESLKNDAMQNDTNPTNKAEIKKSYFARCEKKERIDLVINNDIKNIYVIKAMTPLFKAI